MEQMGDLIKRLKNCVRWFKRVEEGYVQEKEKLQTDLESAEKKCVDIGEPSSSL
jgi:kinesin family protein C1